MFGENKNLKDLENKTATQYGIGPTGVSIKLSYTKTDKLITALYMVTDIMDRDEPLRNKLRTLGVGIISDINSTLSSVGVKIAEIMSFLGIASDMNIISEMNCKILKKEFAELDLSIKELTRNSLGVQKNLDRSIDLSELFKEDIFTSPQVFQKTQYQSIGHHNQTRIGVQKGSTLLKALSDRTRHLSDKKSQNIEAYNILKNQRRDEIKNSIKANGGNATITDIKNKAFGSILTCGEKTLQRELVSMVKEGVLKKAGEKRWSRYFLVA